MSPRLRKEWRYFRKRSRKSVQRHFLYAGSSDFIYAITVEQYGILIGGLFQYFCIYYSFIDLL